MELETRKAGSLDQTKGFNRMTRWHFRGMRQRLADLDGHPVAFKVQVDDIADLLNAPSLGEGADIEHLARGRHLQCLAGPALKAECLLRGAFSLQQTARDQADAQILFN